MKFKHSYSTPQYNGNYTRQSGVPFATNYCDQKRYLNDPVGFGTQICYNKFINNQNKVLNTPFGRCSDWRFVNTQTEISNQREIIDGTDVITENGQYRNPRLAIFSLTPQPIYQNIKDNRV